MKYLTNKFSRRSVLTFSMFEGWDSELIEKIVLLEENGELNVLQKTL